MIHCSGGNLNSTTSIGSRVFIGVGATIHGATIEDECYVGDKATILDNAIVKKHSVVATGSVVSPKTVIPSGQLWSGIPARYERDLTYEEISKIAIDISSATELAVIHAKEHSKDWETIVEDAETLEEDLNRNSHYYQTTPRTVNHCFYFLKFDFIIYFIYCIIIINYLLLFLLSKWVCTKNMLKVIQFQEEYSIQTVSFIIHTAPFSHL